MLWVFTELREECARDMGMGMEQFGMSAGAWGMSSTPLNETR
jgi:hypothetical protein